MQKVVNVLAVASSVVSLAVVGTAGYVFVNKDAIIKGGTDSALEVFLGWWTRWWWCCYWCTELPLVLMILLLMLLQAYYS